MFCILIISDFWQKQVLFYFEVLRMQEAERLTSEWTEQQMETFRAGFGSTAAGLSSTQSNTGAAAEATSNMFPCSSMKTSTLQPDTARLAAVRLSNSPTVNVSRKHLIECHPGGSQPPIMELCKMSLVVKKRRREATVRRSDRSRFWC